MRAGWIAAALLLCLGTMSAPRAEIGSEVVEVELVAPETAESSEPQPCACCEPCPCGGACRDELHFAGPMASVNTHPPNAMFLSPVPDRAAIQEYDSHFRLSLDWTSVIIRELDSGIVADYDMEVMRLSGDWQARLGRGEVNVRLPLTYRWSGIQDDIIRTWHSWFGLPNALREILPDNQYSYVIISRDGPVINDSGGFGIGDLTVGYKHPLWDRRACDGDAAALRAVVKLPTGSRDKALSSGNYDISVGALYERQISRRIRGYVNYDLVFIGKPELDNVGWQDHHVYLIAAEYAVSSVTSVVAQLQHHGNPLVIGSYEADKDPHQLSLGLQRRLGRNKLWTIGFTEDLRPETAPDFVINSYLRWSF